MPSQDNMPQGGPTSAFPVGNPPLADVARELSPPLEDSTSAKPQVVFVGGNKPADVETNAAPTVPANKPAEAVKAKPAVARMTVSVKPVSRQPVEDQNASPAAPAFVPPVLDLMKKDEDAQSQSSNYLFDPFALELDGPVPAMTTLPIVEAIAMTQKVVSREKAGTHYAWRLKPGPYPDLGNKPEVSSEDEPQPEPPFGQGEPELQASVLMEEASQSDEANDPGWSDTQLVADSGFDSLGDSFIVQPGEVISIDGNQGYDHIDLRSYRIEDAIFQPGSILLSSDMLSAEDEKTPAPITIRHRGVAFAIFKGDVRVQL